MSLLENIRDEPLFEQKCVELISVKEELEVIKIQFIELKAVNRELIAENAATKCLKDKLDLKDKHIYCLEQEVKELHMKLENSELAQAQLIKDKNLLQDDRNMLAKQLKEERDCSIIEMKMKTCTLAKNQLEMFNGSVESKIMVKNENQNLCKMDETQADAKIKHLNTTNEKMDKVISKQHARIEQLEMENRRLSSAIVDLKNMHVEKNKRNKKKIDEFKFEIFSLKEKTEELYFKYQKEKEEYTKKTVDKIKFIKKQFQTQEKVSEKPEELNLQNIRENVEKPQSLKRKKEKIMCEETENNKWNPQKKRPVSTRQCSEDSPSAAAHF